MAYAGDAYAAVPYAGASADSGTSGTITATLPSLSANLVGGIEFSGAITAILPALGADIAGESYPPGIAGDLTAVLPPLGGSLVGAYSDTGILAAILPPLSANLTGAYGPTSTLDATLPALAANLSGTSADPGTSGYLAAVLPALSASFAGHVVGRAGFGLALDSSATVTVDAALDATVTSTTVPLHVVTPTVPVPTLVAGRPS